MKLGECNTKVMDGGWIKLHRKIRHSDVSGDYVGWAVWTWCLVCANWEAKKWRGNVIHPGQFVTGRKVAAAELGMTESMFYRTLKRLEKYGYIRTATEQGSTVVTVCNWVGYQDDELPPEQQPNNDRTLIEQQVNTDRTLLKKERSKEGKKQTYARATVEEVEEYCSSRGNDIDPQQFVDYYTANGWKVGRSAMKDWRAAVRTWERRSNGEAPSTPGGF